MDKYQKFKEALLKAKKAALRARTDDDGGTCNFDSPVVLYRAMHYSIKKASEVIESVGLASWQWCPGSLVISGACSGQANCRTRMAEAFQKSLAESGVESGVYYQMD